MKKISLYFAAALITATSLSSCSRTNYALTTPQTPASTSVAVATPASPAAEMSAQVVEAAPAVAEPTIAAAPVAVATPAAAPIAKLTPKQQKLVEAVKAQLPAATAAAATTPAKAAKPTLAQRLLVNKVMKQVAKAQARQQNTASVTHTAAKAPGVSVGLIGLAALIVGIIVGSGFVTVAGAILIVVGIVLYVLSA
jgi:hypothetical protein